MRVLTAVAFLALAGIGAAGGQDPAAVLSAARVAMGGDAVLDAITSLSAAGSESQDIGPVTTSRSLEIHYQAPDKFLRTTRTTFNDPFGGGFTMTTRNGFNGSVRIHSVIAPGAPMPVVIPGNEPRTADEKKALEDTLLLRQRQDFARLMLALFAAAPDAYPVTFRMDAGAIVATGRDGHEIRIFFDPATGRPARLTWMAEPIRVVSTSRTVTTNSRGDVVSESPNVPFRPPPPASQSLVEWSTTFEDYKTENGITWPRRFRTSIGGRRYEDVRLSRYRINPRIDPSIFEPRK